MSEAIFGLVGVVVGASITLIKEEWSSWRTRRRHARYLAIRVVCILDKYIGNCVEVVQDDGLCCGQRDKDGCLTPQVSLPAPPVFPEDVDWKSIDHELMYRLLALPNDAEVANCAIGFISSEVASPPDYEEAFEERHDRYVKLGLKAAEIADEIRQAYGIPRQDQEDWNPIKHLKETNRRIEKLRHDRKKRIEDTAKIVEPAA